MFVTMILGIAVLATVWFFKDLVKFQGRDFISKILAGLNKSAQ